MQEFYIFILNTSANRMKHDLLNVNIILYTVWDPIVCALNECTGTVFCIWPDVGSVSRNMSPNF